MKEREMSGYPVLSRSFWSSLPLSLSSGKRKIAEIATLHDIFGTRKAFLFGEGKVEGWLRTRETECFFPSPSAGIRFSRSVVRPTAKTSNRGPVNLLAELVIVH
jgi:hypothetical protein